MKHLNKKIGMLGQKLVCDYLKTNKINYWTNFNDNYNITDIVMQRNNKLSFVEVSTKSHTKKKGCKVTGKNKKQIDLYLKRQRDFGVIYFIVFVDIKTKSIYGNYLNNLMNLSFYNDNEFPIVENCGGQEIMFFNLNSMIKLKDLDVEELDNLSKLHFANKFNKNQLLIL